LGFLFLQIKSFGPGYVLKRALGGTCFLIAPFVLIVLLVVSAFFLLLDALFLLGFLADFEVELGFGQDTSVKGGVGDGSLVSLPPRGNVKSECSNSIGCSRGGLFGTSLTGQKLELTTRLLDAGGSSLEGTWSLSVEDSDGGEYRGLWVTLGVL
jgi:hypothetical protein